MISPDSESAAASPPLPPPLRERWQPLRSGVLNLYRYDYEEFRFEDGRLLLRGNNGSGKSRVLALQLPFLIDGEVTPARVEPDGDAAKRIEWNLLMGRYPDRTGYTWIEFGRRDPDGTPRFLTLGCGLRAVAGHSGLHSRWFFVTSQRIGRDLFLQTAQRVPLGRDKLEAALGAAGRLVHKVDDYRRIVDEELFGLGPRFGPLVELLLRLRRPQLSRKLDEDELSAALSDALPTLPAGVIDDVAESFSSLQSDRGKLREFAAASEAVTAFLDEYVAYVRVAVKRRADAVRRTHAAYEAAQRAVRDAERRFAAAVEQLESLVRQQSASETQLAGAESAARTLRESPEMKTAEEIRLASQVADATAKARADAANELAQATAAEQRAREAEQRAAQQLNEIREELERKRREADAAAAAADVADEHRRHFGTLDTAFTASELSSSADAALQRPLAQRARALGLLRSHEKSVAETRSAFEQAETERRRAEDSASAARDREHRARDGLSERAAELLENYRLWVAATAILQPAPVADLTEAFAAWVERREGASPLQRAIGLAHADALGTIAKRESHLEQALRRLAEERAEIDAAIDRLTHGETLPPPPPPLRAADRLGRPGAPLWRLCDFRAEVPAGQRAGLEAALQAAGLLDAWVLPDGRVQTGVDDTFLFASGSASPLRRHLGEVLRPAPDPADPSTKDFDLAALERVLARIGLGREAGEHWVAADGSWQLGPLSGRATKATADYIGESTRAEHRRRQLAELRLQLDELAHQRKQAEHDLATAAAQRAQAQAELQAAPPDESVRRAGFELESATRAVADSFQNSERAARESSARRLALDEATAKRERDAADLKLSAWIGRVEELAQATSAYAARLAGLWPTARHWLSSSAQHRSAQEQFAAASDAVASRRQRSGQAAAAAAEAQRHFETLQEMHGETVATILQRLHEADGEVKRLKDALAANQKSQLAATDARAKAAADRSATEQQRLAHEAERRTAIAGLQRLAEQRLLVEADAGLRDPEAGEWSVAQAVEFVRRRIDPLLATVEDDDAAWQRRQDAIHGHIQELRDRLIAHGHQPETHQPDDVVQVRCVFQARSHTMTELRDAFAAEVVERERLLQAKEKEIIENHLLAEAAVELQKLIRAADAWRVSANEELSARPTSSGVRFRFQWEPDTETRFHEVRPTLLRKGELWTPAERNAVAAFLQARIAAEQNADESGSWRDHLGRALDYRKWHRFVVERQQDGQWRRLNRTTYGTGSGGEKALALTLPRFAAAAAHYRSAAPTAPRLVMLDEAFAGIDPTMRAQCMGVLTQFDLDVVMTSELEWGCYRTVPALAIYHLTTLAGVDAVAATRWVWDGRDKRQEDLPPPRDVPPDDAAAEPPGETP